MTYIPLPFDGKRTTWENGHGTGGTYALDTSGRRGAPLAWACRTPGHAATLARIFAGDIDASPARAKFDAEGTDAPLLPWRVCAVCGARHARPGRRCGACASREQYHARAARAAAPDAVLTADAPAEDEVRICAVCGERPARGGRRKCRTCSYGRAARERRREAKTPDPAPPWSVALHAAAPPAPSALVSAEVVDPAVALRVARLARRRALAAWMSGEGSTPPALAARQGEVGA